MKKNEAIQKITDAEWKAMHVVWELGEPTSNEIVTALVPETAWNPNTIRTLLIRLAEKGVLKAVKERDETGHPVMRYTAKYTREDCAKVHGRTFLEKVFKGDAEELLVHFVNDGNLTPEQVAKLRGLLDGIDGSE